MKSILLVTLLTSAAAFAAVALAAPPIESDTSHPGAYVKDSVITTKIKTKLAEKHLSTLTDVQVDTDNAGVVWLSGKAPSKDASDLAGMVAKDTDGVTRVHNQIVVQD